MSRKKCDHKHYYFNSAVKGEKRVKIVIVLTGVTMIAEIAAGMIFGSMALLADGWHMGTHLFALSVTLFTYYYARKHKDNPEFSFGTGKVGALGGFASSILLGLVAFAMLGEGIKRLLYPENIYFNQALIVAFTGLFVNLSSVLLMHRDHSKDYNLKAAYLHVAADTLTSVIAIAALFAGKYLGLSFFDPAAGMVGGVVILKWAYKLLRDTANILLDKNSNQNLEQDIRAQLESDKNTEVTDFHIWPVGEGRYALMASLATKTDKTALDYKNQLYPGDLIVHITIEVNYI